MRILLKLALSAIVTMWSLEAYTQDLAPRAYVVTPMHSNAVTLTYSYSNGDVLLNGVVPITNSSGRIHVAVISYFHTFRFFGRSANVTASLPYGFGDFKGTVMTNETTAHLSGLLGTSFRLSVNLFGGPAMDVPEFRKWRHKTLLGASLKVTPPTGQYDPTKLINLGTNCWSFKPELGYSHRVNRWVFDAYGGVYFFTTNHDYFSRNQYSPGTNTQFQTPIGSFEGHLSRDFRPRLWASLDSNFWVGGVTKINGVENSATLQKNSRIGATVSVPVPMSKHQSLKVSYSNGAYVRYGGDFRNFSIAWQYSWLGRPQ